MDIREEPLEPARLADEDVDEVDAAAVVWFLAARDGDERRDRVRPIRQIDVAVGGGEPENEADDREEQQPRRGEPRGSEALHNRLRVSPPSTGTTVPVTYAARSEARKQTTSAISRVVPSRRSGIVARSASLGPSG